MGENDDFQPLLPKISRNSQTVSNAATVTINHQLQIDTRTAVARLPLRQLGFLLEYCNILIRTSLRVLRVSLIFVFCEMLLLNFPNPAAASPHTSHVVRLTFAHSIQQMSKIFKLFSL